MKIITGSASQALAAKIAKKLLLKISPVEIFTFPDGERRIRIASNVIDQHTIIVQSTATPVDQHYMEVFFLIDGLKRSGAEFVTTVIPYFGYQRQDHIFRDGEAVSVEVIIKLLECVGVDRLISVDMHSSRIPGLFTIPVRHVSALPIFIEIIKKNQWVTDDTVLISPDMGGIRRIKQMAELVKLPYAALEKNRDVNTGFISGDAVGEGSVLGKKRAIIVDDMISSGKTIVLAAHILQKLGLSEIYVFATHPIFSEDAPSILQNAPVIKIFVTDTVPVPESKLFAKLEILSVADIIAEELRISNN